MISIGIIPDGTRRYARKNDLNLDVAYDLAAKKVEDVMKWAFDSKEVDEITVWGLSTENIKRDAVELSLLNSLYKKNFQKVLTSDTVHDYDVAVKIVGNKKYLSPEVAEMAIKTEEATRNNKTYKLNIALAYGGHEELLNAFQKATRDKPANFLTEEDIQRNLYVTRSPDLIIRTSGIQRLSGFMSWQSAYSEIYFSQQLWPEFTQEEFAKAVEFLKATKRNFGK